MHRIGFFLPIYFFHFRYLSSADPVKAGIWTKTNGMKGILSFILILATSASCFGLKFTITDSQTGHSGHVMDQIWKEIIEDLGHDAKIYPRTVLDNTDFFSFTDVLIVSSGVAPISDNQVNTIIAFLTTGKPVYLQSEYKADFQPNKAFATIVNKLGGNFKWGKTHTGDLKTMKVLEPYDIAFDTVKSLPYFWYSVEGIHGCNTIPILKINNAHHGFQFIPKNGAFGSIITTTDQDYVIRRKGDALLKNFIHFLLNPPKTANPMGLDLGPDTSICEGETLSLDPGITGATYEWSNGSKEPKIEVTQSGTYTLTVTKDLCRSSDEIKVTVVPPPLLDLGDDTIVCEKSSVVITATHNGSNISWSTGENVTSITISSPGVYTAISERDNCFSTDSISVQFGKPPLINLGQDTTLCHPASIVIGVPTNPDIQYLWNNGNQSSSITVTNGGTYWLKASENGCTTRDSIIVLVLDIPDIDLGEDDSICMKAQLELIADSEHSSFLWNNGSTKPRIMVTDAGVYKVTVSNMCGSTEDSIRIDRYDCSCKIYTPSAFTPNGDNLNEFFKPSVTCPIADYQLTIFNRWGQKIFETNDRNEDWDGTFKGSKLPQGVYMYTLCIKPLYDPEIAQRGSIIILR